MNTRIVYAIGIVALSLLLLAYLLRYDYTGISARTNRWTGGAEARVGDEWMDPASHEYQMARQRARIDSVAQLLRR